MRHKLVGDVGREQVVQPAPRQRRHVLVRRARARGRELEDVAIRVHHHDHVTDSREQRPQLGLRRAERVFRPLAFGDFDFQLLHFGSQLVGQQPHLLLVKGLAGREGDWRRLRVERLVNGLQNQVGRGGRDDDMRHPASLRQLARLGGDERRGVERNLRLLELGIGPHRLRELVAVHGRHDDIRDDQL